MTVEVAAVLGEVAEWVEVQAAVAAVAAAVEAVGAAVAVVSAAAALLAVSEGRATTLEAVHQRCVVRLSAEVLVGKELYRACLQRTHGHRISTMKDALRITGVTKGHRQRWPRQIRVRLLL